MFRHLCVAAVLVISIAAGAEPSPQVEPKVVSVQTIGRWVANQVAGRYKVIVTTEGWEHVWSRVYVEWLPDPNNSDEEWKSAGIAELVPPGAPGTMILEATAQQDKSGHLIITVRATPNQDLTEFGIKQTVYRFEATTPGNVRRLKSVPR